MRLAMHCGATLVEEGGRVYAPPTSPAAIIAAKTEASSMTRTAAAGVDAGASADAVATKSSRVLFLPRGFSSRKFKEEDKLLLSLAPSTTAPPPPPLPAAAPTSPLALSGMFDTGISTASDRSPALPAGQLANGFSPLASSDQTAAVAVDLSTDSTANAHSSTDAGKGMD